MKKSLVVVAVSTVPIAVACGLDVVGAGPPAGAIPDSSSSSSSSSGTPSPTSTTPPVDAPADAPSLTPPLLALTRTATTATVDLTALGTLDWTHWSQTSLVPERKLVPTPQIGALANTGTGAVQVEGAGFIFYTWSDGQPTAAQTVISHVFVADDAAKISLRIAADTAKIRTAHFFVGSTAARSRVSVTLSDGSATKPAPIETNVDFAAADDYRVQFRAASAGAELVIEFEMVEKKLGGNASAIRVAAATVSE